MEEKWKRILIGEGYFISTKGRIFRKERKYVDVQGRDRFRKSHFIKPIFHKIGYVLFSFYENGKMKSIRVHRLVAESFISNPENKPYINHKDGNKRNNDVSNLEWVTPKENSDHAVKNGLVTIFKKGIDNPNCKLDESIVISILNEILKENKAMVQIAKDYGISTRTIYFMMKEVDRWDFPIIQEKIRIIKEKGQYKGRYYKK